MPRVKKTGTVHTKTTTTRMDTPPATGVPGPDNVIKRMTMIAEAAYFLAEKRQFTPGHELGDWLAAEREIDAQLPRTSPLRPLD